METDYESPPHPFRPDRPRMKHKRVYGKKGRRNTVGGSHHLGTQGEQGDESSSEEGQAGGRVRGSQSTGVSKNRGRSMAAKGKGKQVATNRDEGADSSSSEVVSAHQASSRSRLSQVAKLPTGDSRKRTQSLPRAFSNIVDTRGPKPSTISQTSGAPSSSPGRRQNRASTSSRVSQFQSFVARNHNEPPSNSAPIPRLNQPHSTRPEARRNSNGIISSSSRLRGKTSIETSTKQLRKDSILAHSPSNDLQVYRAALPSSPLRALSDKSNFLPSSVHPSRPVPTNSPNLTDLPSTLPHFTRIYSTRSSLAQPQPRLVESPKKSASKLFVLNDSSKPQERVPPPLRPIASTSKGTSRPSTVLKAPASPLTSSHSNPRRSPPTFRFTTTIFDNSTSFTSTRPRPYDDHHDLVELIGEKVVEGKEGDGYGMESTFVLESFGEGGEPSERDQVVGEEAGSVLLGQADEILGGVGTAILIGIGQKKREEEGKVEEKCETIEMESGRGVDLADESTFPARSETSAQVIAVEVESGEGETSRSERDADESKFEEDDDDESSENEGWFSVGEGGVTRRSRVEQLSRGSFDRFSEVFASESINDSPTASDPNDISTTVSHADPSSPSPRPTYSASFLPPRLPRSPRCVPPSPSSSPPLPSSSEDDLAYLIRTTATHSSEDDLLPPKTSDSDLSSDEKDFRAAEREAGRGVKTSSGQRRKRVELRDKMRRSGLRIGQGKGGRRLGWKREILDLTAKDGTDEGDLGEDELGLMSLEEGKREKREG